ncbi:tRNA-dihydrouridine synthase family protein, partial [Desulfovibrio sp. XJ01]|nr:tRNA-dihydrouridine synthase family protein [Nitratidesulfovibrio liaohensis]
MPKTSPPNISPHDAMTDAAPGIALETAPDTPAASDAALAARLRAPLTVGGRTVPGRLWLAPMAGLGHA